MRLVRFERDGRRAVGVLSDGAVTPIEDVEELDAKTLEFCLGPHRHRFGTPLTEGEVRLLPPISRPGKIICVGLNYRAHAAESKRDLTEYPVLFTKFAQALIGPGDPVILPPESGQVDYEGELAVIIGRRARRVSAHDALGFVAGYAVANDVTMRDYQYKTHQWLQGKSWDHSTPLGPALVTRDEVADPAALRLELSLNGETMQSADTSAMIFDVPYLVSAISEFTTLDPGDVLLTGTPSGVGYRRSPQRFLTDGDVVEVSVASVGRISNRVISETVPAQADDALSTLRRGN